MHNGLMPNNGGPGSCRAADDREVVPSNLLHRYGQNIAVQQSQLNPESSYPMTKINFHIPAVLYGQGYEMGN